MNKARKKFIMFAELAIVLLLALLLSVINVINFAMAAEEADTITKQISQSNGYVRGGENPNQNNNPAPGAQFSGDTQKDSSSSVQAEPDSNSENTEVIQNKGESSDLQGSFNQQSESEKPDGEPPQIPDGEIPNDQPPQMADGEMPNDQPPQMADGEMPNDQPPQMPDGQMPEWQPPRTQENGTTVNNVITTATYPTANTNNTSENGDTSIPDKKSFKPSGTGNNGGFHLNNRGNMMGPNSAEMSSSLRYFTYAFDENGNAEKISFRISAVTEEEALEWASSLVDGSTGWTNITYRYRVYTDNDKTYVTVIDQSRELWPCYRILIITVIGGIVVVLLSLILLVLMGKKMFKPVEDADRKQKQFIAKLENEFKMPLTIINANTETLEREGGSNEETKSINKQVKRMTRLVKELGALTVLEDADKAISKINLSDYVVAMLENNRTKFVKKNITLEYDIDSEVVFSGDEESFRRVVDELISNSLKFSVSRAGFTLNKQNDRIKFYLTNDTNLPDGSCDQIFDRFTTLENNVETGGAGLGLSYVKDIVRSHNGRVNAEVKDGIMNIRIDL